MTEKPMEEPPVRLCCGQRHLGVVCPDGLVMCQICFRRVEISALYVDEEEWCWDICQPCAKREGLS